LFGATETGLDAYRCFDYRMERSQAFGFRYSGQLSVLLPGIESCIIHGRKARACVKCADRVVLERGTDGKKETRGQDGVHTNHVQQKGRYKMGEVLCTVSMSHVKPLLTERP
jgi:hypothetical protein